MRFLVKTYHTKVEQNHTIYEVNGDEEARKKAQEVMQRTFDNVVFGEGQVHCTPDLCMFVTPTHTFVVFVTGEVS